MSIDKKNENPIGVFDSGVGGISVLRELVKIMPNENYLYFGDSINAPYGTKEVSVIRELTIKNIEKLLDMGAKSIVVACNTATSAAVRVLRQMYPEIPLVGIEPAIKPAVEYKEKSRVVVMATPMTLKQEKFQNLMEKYDFSGKKIILFATSGGSGFGNTVKELQPSAPNSEIVEGKLLNRATKQEIADWIKEI